MMTIKSVRKISFTIFSLSMITIAIGCYPVLKKEAKQPEEALRRIRLFSPEFSDDMDPDSLALAVRRSVEYLDRLSPDVVFQYGPDEFTNKQVRESLEAFLDLLSKGLAPDNLSEEIRSGFRIYRASGRAGNRRVLFTGYYEPVYDASPAPDEVFRYPLYRQPDDLIRIDLSLFNEKFKEEHLIARIEDNKVVPYYSRRLIEEESVLAGKGLEMAWLKDPLDVAFLHIQGSGRLRLPDGKELLVHYRASNGRPYRSIGRYMIEKGFVKREEISMQAIRKYLTGNPEVLEDVLNYNPSYVFFQQVENGPSGSIGVLLTPGRSIALDFRIFPKGALGFIVCEKPSFNEQGEIVGWSKFTRFVVNQDTGGSIKGAGRADIFWGSGPYAELTAGHLRHEGDLYILIKKP